jgi:transcriptional regulator with XRE-family HTH domain
VSRIKKQEMTVNDSMVEFFHRLRAIASIKNKFQTDLVAGLGKHSSTISKWWNGEIVPGPKNMRLIADYFGCNIEWLAKGKGEMFPENRPLSLGSGGDDDDDDDDDEYEEYEDDKNKSVPTSSRKEHYKENNVPRQGHPFGKRLQYLLDVKQIKEVDAAKAVGIGGYKFKLLLDGHVFRPKLDTLQRISNYFCCDIDWLADGKGEPFPMKNRLVSSTSEPETKTIRMYRELAQMDADTLGEIQTWLNDMENLRPGFTGWFRLEFQNRFPEFDDWKRKIIKKQTNGTDY